jgi:protein-L-isoaspartate(D-aspartate) O-methyltransferase
MWSKQNEVSRLHQALVDQLKREGEIRSPCVEAAFRAVPRHLFLPDVPPEQVYRDEAIPTKHLDGRAVSSSSQPAIMATMLEQLALEPGHRVLEIGAGTGYNAALMAQIVGDAGQVVTLDIDDDIVARAREHLSAAGYRRVEVLCRDGGFGCPEGAPFDRIILTVGAVDIAPAWREQLKEGGRLVLPLSIRGPQESVAFERVDGHLASVWIEGCGFMMLRGAFATPTLDDRLGPEPGLYLSAPDAGRIDPEAVYRWLTGPGRDGPIPTRVLPREAYGGLRLWLALREPGFCDLYAVGEMADRGIVPCLAEWPGEWKLCSTSGLLAEAGLCVLARTADRGGVAYAHSEPASSAPEEPAREASVSIRSFGPDDALARRLAEQVAAWDAAGRPAIEKLRIRAYPAERECLPAASEIVVRKPWTQLVLDWRQ